VAGSMPTSDMTVAEILEEWPETVSVFQDFKTACVGCVMAPFDTMVDVARIYELELSEIMGALHRVVESAGRLGRTETKVE
jgi:hybrid cluster-associated redox disulfide protein